MRSTSIFSLCGIASLPYTCSWADVIIDQSRLKMVG